MTQNPDALRADIEQTRRRLSTNVDAVADKVTPSHIVNRRVDRIKTAVFGAATMSRMLRAMPRTRLTTPFPVWFPISVTRRRPSRGKPRAALWQPA